MGKIYKNDFDWRLMETSGLNHIIMTIKDVAISGAFYDDLLGFEIKTIADGFVFNVGGIRRGMNC